MQRVFPEKAHQQHESDQQDDPSRYRQIVMLDDVISSGGTKLDAIRELEQAFHVKPAGIVVVVDRRLDQQDLGVPVQAALCLGDLVDYLEATGDERAQQIRDYSGGSHE